MKSFLKTFFASYFGSCFGILTICALPIVALMAIASVIVSSMGNKIEATLNNNVTPAPIEGKTFLVIDISRGFSDHPTFSKYNRIGIFGDGNGHYGLLDTVRALKMAETDNDICGVFMTGSGCDAGYATIQEIREAIKEFKSSKKPVIAYLPAPTTRDYFLATDADKIWIHPLADLPLNGLSSTGIYYKNALEKAGIGIQITKVGKFKSAVEPLISDHMSEEDKEQRGLLLKTNWEKISNDIGEARNVKISDYKAILTAEEAQKAKLIDAAKYTDETISELTELGEYDSELSSFKQVPLDTYLTQRNIVKIPALNEEEPSDDKDAIAVIYAEGEIVDGNGALDEIGGEQLAGTIREIRTDSSIKAIILRVNSPGGSVFASEQIRRELELVSKNTPLFVSMGDVAASGGYWISTPAKKIFAGEMTITGSIGVFGVLVNVENLGKKLGIASEAVTTGALAEINTIRRPKNEQELAVIQKSVDEIYGKFTSLVCDSRKIPEDKMPNIAEGRVWSGKHAMSINLVDGYMSLAGTIEYVKKELGSTDLKIREYPRSTNRMQEVFDMFKEEEPTPFAKLQMGGNSAAGIIGRSFISTWKKLQALNDPKNIYARLPWELEELSE